TFKFRMSEDNAPRFRNITLMISILSSILGPIVIVTNWISTTEYVYHSALYRVFSPSISTFGIILTFIGLSAFLFHRALKEE
ncbi:MAG: hypothetical protein RTV72_11720, partial [Candidatus Thorarchaeota archaeon]